MVPVSEFGVDAVIVSRRDLLKAGVGAAALATIPRPLLAYFDTGPEPVPPIGDGRIKELAFRAVEAALAVGASYVDVRLTHTRTRNFMYSFVENTRDSEELTVGVRTLVDGYWGFASGHSWSTDEVVRLGREAVYHARVNSLGRERRVELAERPVVVDVHWETPVEIDPFEVSPFEIVDFFRGLEYYTARDPEFKLEGQGAQFEVKEQAFACSDGTYITQRLYGSSGSYTLTYWPEPRVSIGWQLAGLTRASVGWELYKGQPLREQIDRLREEMREFWKLPIKPVEVGRYDVVCDALSVARLIDGTLANATELDRALGYEANADGTSYLNDPFGMIGSHVVGAPALTITANRSEPGGAATVRWDDEGVEPDEFTIVKDGVLTDFQTTRESASWLAEHYRAKGVPVRSHGCAAAEAGIHAPIQRRPNLVVAPGKGEVGFSDLIAGLSDGIAVEAMGVDIDFQGLNGFGGGDRVYEVKGGKRVARIVGAGFLFRAPELWKNLKALGGPNSVERFGLQTVKGQPTQTAFHSVTAPPALFTGVTVVDALRKA